MDHYLIMVGHYGTCINVGNVIRYGEEYYIQHIVTSALGIHFGHEGKMSVSGYRDRQFKLRLH